MTSQNMYYQKDEVVGWLTFGVCPRSHDTVFLEHWADFLKSWSFALAALAGVVKSLAIRNGAHNFFAIAT